MYSMRFLQFRYGSIAIRSDLTITLTTHLLG